MSPPRNLGLGDPRHPCMSPRRRTSYHPRIVGRTWGGRRDGRTDAQCERGGGESGEDPSTDGGHEGAARTHESAWSPHALTLPQLPLSPGCTKHVLQPAKTEGKRNGG